MGHMVQTMMDGDAWDLVRDISLACAGRGSLRWVAYADGAQLEDEEGVVHGFTSLAVFEKIEAHQRALKQQEERRQEMMDKMSQARLLATLLISSIGAQPGYSSEQAPMICFDAKPTRPAKRRDTKAKPKPRKKQQLGRRDTRRRRC